MFFLIKVTCSFKHDHHIKETLVDIQVHVYVLMDCLCLVDDSLIFSGNIT